MPDLFVPPALRPNLMDGGDGDKPTAEEVYEIMKDWFLVTEKHSDAGFILPDGTMLDVGHDHDSITDQEDIEGHWKFLSDMMREYKIVRVSGFLGELGVEYGHRLTPQQKKQLELVIPTYRGRGMIIEDTSDRNNRQWAEIDGLDDLHRFWSGTHRGLLSAFSLDEADLEGLMGRGGFVARDGEVLLLGHGEDHNDYPEWLMDPEVVRFSGFGGGKGIDYGAPLSRKQKTAIEQVIANSGKKWTITDESKPFVSGRAPERWAEVNDLGSLRDFWRGRHTGFLRITVNDPFEGPIEMTREEIMERIRQLEGSQGVLMGEYGVDEMMETQAELAALEGPAQFSLEDEPGQNQLEPSLQELNPKVVIREDMERLLSEMGDLMGQIMRGDFPAEQLEEMNLAYSRGLDQLELMKKDLERTVSDLKKNGLSYFYLPGNEMGRNLPEWVEELRLTATERFNRAIEAHEADPDPASRYDGMVEWMLDVFGREDVTRWWNETQSPGSVIGGLLSPVGELPGRRREDHPAMEPGSVASGPPIEPSEERHSLREMIEPWLLEKSPYTAMQLDPERGIEILGQPIGVTPQGTVTGMPLGYNPGLRAEQPMEEPSGLMAPRPIRDPFSEPPNILQEATNILGDEDFQRAAAATIPFFGLLPLVKQAATLLPQAAAKSVPLFGIFSPSLMKMFREGARPPKS